MVPPVDIEPLFVSVREFRCWQLVDGDRIGQASGRLTRNVGGSITYYSFKIVCVPNVGIFYNIL